MNKPLDVALADAGAKLALDLAADQIRTLIGFLELLQRWNATYNLTAVRDPQQMLVHHIADCMAVIRPLRRHLSGDIAGRRLLDVGSGGGLPGFVIAALLPELRVTCVDSVRKKTAFVVQAAAELGLANLHAVHARVEKLELPPFDMITSRAFGSLADLVAATRRLLLPSGAWMAMKAKRPVAEIAALPNDVNVFHVEQLQVPGLDAERCLVWIAPSAPVGASP